MRVTTGLGVTASPEKNVAWALCIKEKIYKSTLTWERFQLLKIRPGTIKLTAMAHARHKKGRRWTMWMVGALRSQVDVPIWQIRATRVAACLLAGGPDVPAKADGPPPVREPTGDFYVYR